MILFHATIGSFVIYIVLNDIFGPAEPTKFIDGLLKCGKNDKSKTPAVMILPSRRMTSRITRLFSPILPNPE